MSAKYVRAMAAAFLLAALTLPLPGCGDDDPAGPAAVAPTVPDPARLTVDLGFFLDNAPAVALAGDPARDRPRAKEPGAAAPALDPQARANFTAAYLRALVVGAWTAAVLAPPVAATAVTLHQTPQRQPDGSWLWITTHVQGDQEWQIRLRGTNLPDDAVAWQMRVSCPTAPVPFTDQVWFEGATTDDGAAGSWTFHDPTLSGDPEVARVEWGRDGSTDTLALTALAGADAGDQLTFSATGPQRMIALWDESILTTWYISWNEEDHTGSLMVPDYNGGEAACWDENLDDTACTI